MEKFWCKNDFFGEKIGVNRGTKNKHFWGKNETFW